MTIEQHWVCTGTLVEHLIGPVECTDAGCTAAVEEHWLVVRCEELDCRSCAGDPDGILR